MTNTDNNVEQKFNLDEFPKLSMEEWKIEAELSLKGKPIEKLISQTYEGIDILPIYDDASINDIDLSNNSFPGYYPFLRDNNYSGVRTQPVKIAQELNYSLPQDFNNAIINSIARGQNEINLRVINPFMFDYNSIDFISNEDFGLIINNVDDFDIAFKNVDLTKISIYINSKSAIAVQLLFIAFLKKNKYDLNKIKCGFSFDPLGKIVSNGKIDFDINTLYDRLSSFIFWTKTNIPNISIFTIDGSLYSNGGASDIEELAFSFATAIEYIRQMQKRNLEIDDIAQKIKFNFSIGSNFFMEIAKLRASRVLWAKIIKNFGGNENSQKFNVHSTTGYINKSMLDPFANMLRTSTEALSAIIGGSDSLNVSTYDELFNIPNEFSERIARNTQIILGEECDLKEVIDPAGGAYFIEYLTYSIAKKSWELLQNVEHIGSMEEAIIQGFSQDRVSNIANKRIQNISTRKDIFIGVNKSPNQNDSLNIKFIDNKKNQYIEIIKNKIDGYKNNDDEQFDSEIKELTNVINSNFQKSIDLAIELAIKGCSINSLEKLYKFKSINTINIKSIIKIRLAEKFEELRLLSENYKGRHNYYPRVFLLNYGSIKDYKARNDFSTDFFQVGGFEVISSQPVNTIDEAENIILNDNCSIVVLCSSDAKYPEFVSQLTQSIKKGNDTKKVILAGYPTECIEEFKSAGIDEFIHIKANIYTILRGLLEGIESNKL